MNKLPLSALLITRNEERYIERALKSLSFADEIIIVDSGSIDRTCDIARDLAATVYSRAWTGFCDQRNFSLEKAKHDWVLVLDADEAATDGLKDWLSDFFAQGAQNTKIFGYKICRTEYFLGKEIKGSCWNPSYQDRFFHRKKAKYVGEIHEYPIVEGGLMRAPEQAKILHNPNITVESFLDKMNRYTSVEAWDRYEQGQRTNLAHMFVTFFSTWWKNFFYYKAYQDGVHGFVISLMEAVSRTVRHIKLWQIQSMKKNQREDLLLSPNHALESGANNRRSLETSARHE